MMAFHEELTKIAAARSPSSAYAPKTVGAPRSKFPSQQTPKAPTAPGKLNVKIVAPAAQFGKRQNYSQPNAATQPTTNPAQGEKLRNAPPPNVVFGVR